MEFGIRKVDLTDVVTLAALCRKTFFDTYYHLNTPDNMEAYASQNFTLTKLEQEISTPGSVYYFALNTGTPIGYIKLNHAAAQSDLQEDTSFEVERIYVDAAYQNQRIGRKLIDFAQQIAKDAGMESLWLSVWEHNEKAARFYERNGFEQFSTHHFMLGDDLQIDRMLRKMLV